MTFTESRRRFLATLSSLGVISIAGCSSTESNDTGDTDTSTDTDTAQDTAVLTDDEGEFADEETTTQSPPSSTTTPTQTETSSSTATSTIPGLKNGFSEDTLAAARSVGETTQQATVFLQPYRDGRPVGRKGTGWFVDDSHVVTNAHVVEGVKDGLKFTAWTYDGTQHDLSLVATGTPYETDIALLSLDSGTAPASLSVAESTSLSPGDPLVQVGHPLFIGNWIVTLGRFQRRTNSDDLTSAMPHDTGSSGAPVLNLDGTVVGMHWGSQSDNESGPPGGRPETADQTVYTELPYLKRVEAVAEPASALTTKINEWR